MQTVAVAALRRLRPGHRVPADMQSSTMDTLPHEQSDLEGDSLTYWKPVETV